MAENNEIKKENEGSFLGGFFIGFSIVCGCGILYFFPSMWPTHHFSKMFFLSAAELSALAGLVAYATGRKKLARGMAVGFAGGIIVFPLTIPFILLGGCLLAGSR